MIKGIRIFPGPCSMVPTGIQEYSACRSEKSWRRALRRRQPARPALGWGRAVTRKLGRKPMERSVTPESALATMERGVAQVPPRAAAKTSADLRAWKGMRAAIEMGIPPTFLLCLACSLISLYLYTSFVFWFWGRGGVAVLHCLAEAGPSRAYPGCSGDRRVIGGGERRMREAARGEQRRHWGREKLPAGWGRP